jgi:hypothetical protein
MKPGSLTKGVHQFVAVIGHLWLLRAAYLILNSDVDRLRERGYYVAALAYAFLCIWAVIEAVLQILEAK